MFSKAKVQQICLYIYFTWKCIFTGNLQKYEILNENAIFHRVSITSPCGLYHSMRIGVATSFINWSIIASNQNKTFFTLFTIKLMFAHIYIKIEIFSEQYNFLTTYHNYLR